MMQIVSSLFVIFPIAMLVFWIICLEEYLRGKSMNKRQPGSVSDAVMHRRKALLIVSSVIAGVLLACVIGVIVLFYMVIAFM